MNKSNLFIVFTIYVIFILATNNLRGNEYVSNSITLSDSTVSPEQGGEGFTGEGWITNMNYNTIGNPNAVKGGSIVLPLQDFPVTFRVVGEYANYYWNYIFYYELGYESLLGLDPVTLDDIPRLATHWWISEDKKEFKFRINPKARWSDGMPVTTEDVIATWKLLVDPGIRSPYTNELFQGFDMPIAESKYIVSVKTKDLDWRMFKYFSQISLLPAHVIGGLTGDQFLNMFDFEYVPGSGPYALDPNNVVDGKSITLTRRNDYWGYNEPWNKGKFNFDQIKFELVKGSEFEAFLNGNIDIVDLTTVSKIRDWKKLDSDNSRTILRKEVFNKYPSGVRGICFNMRKPPFDDVNIRKALSYLYDRERFINELYDGYPKPEDSYWDNSEYANPSNPKVRYNPEEAKKYLLKSGWSSKNSDGYLEKNGKTLEAEITYGSPTLTKFLTYYQEDCKKAGIKIKLKLLDISDSYINGSEREFQMIVAAWGGLLFPNPVSSFGSESADELYSTNWAGVKNTRIDQLCNEYTISFDKTRRVEIVREIDGILADLQPYALSWYYPAQRLALYNKFGYPESILSKFGDLMDDIPVYWYCNPENSIDH